MVPVTSTVDIPVQNEIRLETELANKPVEKAWNKQEKIAFRFFFLYFFLQVVPLDWKYYKYLLQINWLEISFRDIFYISRYTPQFFSGEAQAWGLGTFQDWGVISWIALIGAAIWSSLDRERTNYNSLHLFLRALLRYRLAVGLLAYGFLKFFPMQMPFPTLSNLNTSYGDLTAWKIFSMSTGIVPGYQSFLGLVEILGALLLLSRRTTVFGLLIIIPFMGNVFMSNLAYEGGEHVYSLYLVSIALFLIAFDIPRLYEVLVLQRPTFPTQVKSFYTEAKWKNLRLALKGAFVLLFVGVYGYKSYAAYQQGSYHIPSTQGLPGAAGVYNVSEFKLNGKTLPYSKTDANRWQDVVFEKWGTLSIKLNRPVKMEQALTEEIYLPNQDRNYERAGAAGRQYYTYILDTTQQKLTLKNTSAAHLNKVQLHYSRPAKDRIILSGLNERGDSLYVVLDRIPKKYLLEEVEKRGRRESFKL